MKGEEKRVVGGGERQGRKKIWEGETIHTHTPTYTIASFLSPTHPHTNTPIMISDLYWKFSTCSTGSYSTRS